MFNYSQVIYTRQLQANQPALINGFQVVRKKNKIPTHMTIENEEQVSSKKETSHLFVSRPPFVTMSFGVPT